MTSERIIHGGLLLVLVYLIGLALFQAPAWRGCGAEENCITIARTNAKIITGRVNPLPDMEVR